MRFQVLIACSLWACASGEQRVEAVREDMATPEAPLRPIEVGPAWEHGDFRRAETDGDALVAWRALGGEPPKNRHFELEVWLVRAGEPVAGAELVVRATMPEHGHGMNVEPRALAQPDGSYRVRGMLLHMGGRWELTIHAIEPGRFHGATFELEVR